MAERNEKLDLLVLLFLHSSKQPTLAEVVKQLKTVLAHMGALGAKTALDGALKTCVSAGTVTPAPLQKKGCVRNDFG